MRTSILLLFLVFGTIERISAQNTERTSLIQKSELTENKLSLFDLKNLEKLRNSEILNSVTLIEITPFAGGDLADQTEIFLEIPGRIKGVLSKKKFSEKSASGVSTWIGDVQGGQVLLNSANGEISGQIQLDDQIFEIQNLEDNQTLLLEYNTEKINRLDCYLENSPDQSGNSHSAKGNNGGTAYESGKISSSVAVVNVLFLFTPAAANSGHNLNDMANTIRAQWQSAVINSNTRVTLNVAGVEPFNLTETKKIEDDVTTFANSTAAQQLRNNFEADVVLLLVDPPTYNAAGRVAAVGPIEQSAYGIALVGYATASYTGVHEIGHMFGARHETDSAPGDAHAHLWSSGPWYNRKFYRSILGTNQDYTRILYFSNPYETHNGTATGVVNVSNNSRVINANGPTVEAFRYSTPALGASISGPGYAGNGQSMTFTATVSGGEGPYTLSWRLNTGSGYYYVGNGVTLNATMPSDRNLDVKLTVTDGNSTNYSTYRTVQNYYLDGGCTTCPDMGDALEEDNPKNNVILFPNPAADLITITGDYKDIDPVHIEVISISGERVTAKTSTHYSDEGGLTINIAKLQSGVYLVGLVNQKNEIQYIRFIKD